MYDFFVNLKGEIVLKGGRDIFVSYTLCMFFLTHIISFQLQQSAKYISAEIEVYNFTLREYVCVCVCELINSIPVQGEKHENTLQSDILRFQKKHDLSVKILYDPKVITYL